MLIRLNAMLRRVPRVLVLAASLPYTVLVAWMDQQADPGLDMVVFYLPPLAAVSWQLGRRAGIGFALLATALVAFMGLVLQPPGLDAQLLIWNAAAQFLFFLFAALVISELARQTVALRALAREDPLTGIPNRRAFFGALERVVEWSRRQGGPWVLAYLDADNFKKLNDTQGHAVGDAALRRIARVLRDGTRRIDVVARLGGDEFALLLPETDAREGQTVVAKLLGLLDEAMTREGWDISFSIGAITFVAPPDSIDVAVAMADACMYRVKARGKAGAIFRTWPEHAALELPRGVAAAARMAR